MVSGLEVRTAVGLTTASTAAAVRAGVSRVQEHPRFVGPDGERLLCAFDQELDLELVGPQRLDALCGRPLRRLLQESAWLTEGQPRCPMLLAVPEFRPGYTEADEKHLLAHLQARYSGGSVAVGARGNAGFLQLLGRAVTIVEQSGLRAVVVGAVDSYLDGRTLDWLDEAGRSQAANPRCGFFPGEAAGFAVVQAASSARATRSKVAARLAGWGVQTESVTWMSDDVNHAFALSKAIREAASGLSRREALVESIYCDINGERYRSDEWSTAQLRLNTVFRYAPGQPATYSTAVRQCGDTGAATGVVLLAMAAQSWERSYAKGNNALLFAGSDSGMRAAVVLERGRA